MYYDVAEKSLQAVFTQIIPLSHAQLGRVSELAVALILAGETSLSKIARQLAHNSDQDSRIRWIKRLLEAPFMTQAYLYQPWIKHLLQTHPVETLHLVSDRTDLIDHAIDLVSINLNFRKHALPIVWELCPTGMTSAETQISLLTRCKPLIPAERRVVFHGDNEFGSVAVMQWLRQQQWDFIVGQAAKHYYRPIPAQGVQQLGDLPVTPSQPVYRQNVELTKAHWFGPVNLFAFYQPVYHRNRRKQDIRYYATSLPIAPTVRRLGKRRWGIECFHKDIKSAGWQLPLSQIRHPQRLEGLLITLNLVYTWLTCLGRWLCKTSQRTCVDSHPHRHLSLFRLGWDWLVHVIRRQALCPDLSILYS
jgi:Transposase DDE domain